METSKLLLFQGGGKMSRLRFCIFVLQRSDVQCIHDVLIIHNSVKCCTHDEQYRSNRWSLVNQIDRE